MHILIYDQVFKKIPKFSLEISIISQVPSALRFLAPPRMSSISAILPCWLPSWLPNTDICFDSLYLSLTYSDAPGITWNLTLGDLADPRLPLGDPWVTPDDPRLTQDDPRVTKY